MRSGARSTPAPSQQDSCVQPRRDRRVPQVVPSGLTKRAALWEYVLARWRPHIAVKVGRVDPTASRCGERKRVWLALHQRSRCSAKRGANAAGIGRVC